MTPAATLPNPLTAPPTSKSSDATLSWQHVTGPAPSIDTDAAHWKILIVDDEPTNIKVVRKYLQPYGYRQFITTSKSREAVQLVRDVRPDVILLDVLMPDIDGLEILKQIRNEPSLRFIPVVVLTAASDPATRFRALELGATDFLSKPVDRAELVPRVRNALTLKAHQDYLVHYAEQLEREVRLRTAELTASRYDVIQCLARAGEYRDNETGNHVLRVGKYVGLIARQLGLARDQVELLEQASLLHDVGKIGIPDMILLKPGRLTAEEFAQMKRHCEYGRNIIQPPADSSQASAPAPGHHPIVDTPVGYSPIMAMAARIAYSHHEKWDGTGYPEGLAGEAIPLEARITAAADVYDALSTRRPYKPAFPPQRCFQMMRDQRGKHFDPRVLDAFLLCPEQILRIQFEYADDTELQGDVEMILGSPLTR